MPSVYILSSIKKPEWSYVGMTTNFEKRFSQHCNGRVKSTSPYRPFDIVAIEEYATKAECLFREKYLKSGRGREEKSSYVNFFHYCNYLMARE